MVLDPGIEIPILSSKCSKQVADGRTTLPYLRSSDNLPRIVKADKKEYLYFPFFAIATESETIINGATIPLLHNVPNFNPVNDWHTVQVWVECSIAQHGYRTGEVTTIDRGIGIEVTETEILVNIASSGVKIVKKNGDRNFGTCSVDRWTIFARGFFNILSLETQ